MPDPGRKYLSLRIAALVPVILFAPIVAAFFVAPDAAWGEYVGVFFHLSILLLASRLPAPDWSRAAGYGWVTLDVLAGILAINGVDAETVWAVRLGGHVLAGTWIASSSLFQHSWAVRIVGVVSGVWLAGYSFVAPVLDETFIRPAGLLTLVWFAAIAVTATRSTRAPESEAVADVAR